MRSIDLGKCRSWTSCVINQRLRPVRTIKSSISRMAPLIEHRATILETRSIIFSYICVGNLPNIKPTSLSNSFMGCSFQGLLRTHHYGFFYFLPHTLWVEFLLFMRGRHLSALSVWPKQWPEFGIKWQIVNRCERNYRQRNEMERSLRVFHKPDVWKATR